MLVDEQILHADVVVVAGGAFSRVDEQRAVLLGFHAVDVEHRREARTPNPAA